MLWVGKGYYGIITNLTGSPQNNHGKKLMSNWVVIDPSCMILYSSNFKNLTAIATYLALSFV